MIKSANKERRINLLVNSRLESTRVAIGLS
jgi:hypothetical protein